MEGVLNRLEMAFLGTDASKHTIGYGHRMPKETGSLQALRAEPI